jgi:hypothetical protein
MTYDDSVQIAGRALRSGPRSAADGEARKRRVSRRWETSSFPAVAERRSRGSRPRRHDREGNFSPCKALKTHKNAERISLLRKPVPIGRQNGLAPTGKARRVAGGKGDRAITRATALEGLIRPGRKLQKKAPKALKSLDAEMKSAPRCAPRTYSESSSSPGGRRLARWGCVSSRVCAYQRRPSGRSGGKMRRVCNRLAHPLPRR